MEPVIKTYTRRQIKVTPDIVCCRACLETKGKLYNMREHKLVEAFTRISGITVKEDKFPQHLCMYCVALLRRCAEFRAKCSRAKLLLMAEMMARNLTTEYVHSIDRLSHNLVALKTSEVHVTDKTGHLEQTTQTIEDETNNEGIFIKEEIDSPDTQLHYINDDEVDINGDLFVIKNVDHILNQKNIKEALIASLPKKRVRKTVKSSSNITSTNTNGVKKRKKKRNPKMHYRMPENDYLPVFDFAKFESTYNVKIIILSKEEQIKEIEDRRASKKYLQATYRCEPCGKVFSTEAILKTHLQNHSPSKGAFECDICTERRRTNSKLTNHKDFHRLKLVCECGFVSRNVGAAKRHHQMHQGKKFVCQHCGKCYNVFTTFMTHLRVAHPDMNVVCNMCGETFVSDNGLRFHKLKVHSVKWKQDLKCSICSVEFITPEALERHTEAGEQEGRSPCTYCGESFASQEVLEAHMTDRHPRCDECSATFLDETAYRLHHRRKHLGQPGGPRRRRPRGPHTPHSPRGPRQGRPGRPGHGPRWCEQCNAMLPNENHLRLHMLHRHGVKRLLPFRCSECPRKCDSKGSLEMHMRKHTGEKPFQCDHCKLTFMTKANMLRHILTLHLRMIPRVPCEICGLTYTQRASLKMHINTVHLGMPWPKRRRKHNKKDEESKSDSGTE